MIQQGLVITYASRQLWAHKHNYLTHNLELTMIVCVLKSWRHYLYGMYSDIYTDHRSLQYVMTQRDLNSCQRWWIELLAYYSGKSNMEVDALSQKMVSMGNLAHLIVEEWALALDI